MDDARHGPAPTPMLDGILAEQPRVEAPSYQARSEASGSVVILIRAVDGPLDGDAERYLIDALVNAVTLTEFWDDHPVVVEYHPGGDADRERISADWLLAGDQR